MSNYKVPVLDKFEWQQPVLSILRDPPATPAKGARYIIDMNEVTGDFIGHEGEIATCSNATGPVWEFTVPTAGMVIWNSNDDSLLRYSGIYNKWNVESTEKSMGYPINDHSIYVDIVGGDDDNDGLDEARPVQHLSRAFELVPKVLTDQVSIILAAGDYTASADTLYGVRAKAGNTSELSFIGPNTGVAKVAGLSFINISTRLSFEKISFVGSACISFQNCNQVVFLEYIKVGKVGGGGYLFNSWDSCITFWDGEPALAATCDKLDTLYNNAINTLIHFRNQTDFPFESITQLYPDNNQGGLVCGSGGIFSPTGVLMTMTQIASTVANRHAEDFDADLGCIVFTKDDV